MRAARSWPRSSRQWSSTISAWTPARDPMPTQPGVPRYMELANLLRGRMNAKRPKAGYRPGDKFPPEPDLVDESGYSRETVRASLRILRAERRIRVTLGVGTFVTDPSEWAGKL